MNARQFKWATVAQVVLSLAALGVAFVWASAHR